MVIDPNNQNNQPNPNQPQSSGVGMGQPAQKGSGRFTNLQKYVTSNQGAGQQIGQRIGSQVTNQADQVRQGIQQAKTGFQSKVDTENQRIGQAQNLAQEAVDNTNQFINDPSKLSQFQQLRDAQTAQIDPLQLQQQQQQAAQAAQMAQNANTEQGRFQLLKGAFANPRYTQGVGRLDQLFLQSSPALKDLQQGTKAATQGLGGEIAGAQQYSQEQLAARDAAAKAAQQNIRNTIGREDDPSTPEDESAGAFGTFSKDIFGRLGNKQSELDAQYNEILSKFDAIPNQDPSGIMGKASPDAGTHKAASIAELYQNLNKDQRNLLGLNDDMLIGNMSPEEFKSYLRKKQLGNQERARFFNEDEYNRYQNLGKLMGTNTQQNLTAEEKALLGKGVGDYGLTARPQLEQELQGREAGLWSGGYLNDMPHLAAMFNQAQHQKNTATTDANYRDLIAGQGSPAEIWDAKVRNYLASQGVPLETIDQNTGARKGISFQSPSDVLNQIYSGGSAGFGLPANSPLVGREHEIGRGLADVIKNAEYDWRAGQLQDRARNAGMLQTLSGKQLSADELFERYKSFKDKGLI